MLSISKIVYSLLATCMLLAIYKLYYKLFHTSYHSFMLWITCTFIKQNTMYGGKNDVKYFINEAFFCAEISTKLVK